MHHATLLRCLSVLGLSACTTTTPAANSADALGPEPSGLGMTEHEAAPASDETPRFVAEDNQWCDVWIDARGRALEPTPSFLQAWNLATEDAQPTMHYVAGSPLSEDEARVRICGSASCKIERPQILPVSSGGGPAQRAGTMRAGFAVLVPSKRGTLVVPVAGVQGGCSVAPELRTAYAGSLVHITALVHEGDYARYYYEGHHGHGYGLGHGGGCNRLSTSRTDIVIDLETAQLELVLTQASTPTRPEPQVDVQLGPRGIELHGCAGVLELAWTG